MNEEIKPIDFSEIIEQVAKADENKITAGQIAILGGRIDLQAAGESMFEGEELAPGTTQPAVGKINQFLERWKPIVAPKACVIWETMDGISMPPIADCPQADENFVRARLFGTKGDLSLRCDGDYLYWHFIGNTNAGIPKLR